jgi:hypothetical protein
LFFIFNPVLTEVKTDGPVFRQDIIQGDTLKGSDWDAGGGGGEGGGCDTCPTLVFTRKEKDGWSLMRKEGETGY